MADKQKIGRLGEELAFRKLRQEGYHILERNFCCPLGEIDLIAREGGDLVFIEVKTRSSKRFGLPQEAVDWRKQRRLYRLAEYYMISKNLTATSCRFDVAAVLLTAKTQPGFK